MKKIVLGVVAIAVLYFLFFRGKKIKTPTELKKEKINSIKAAHDVHKSLETEKDLGKADYTAVQKLIKIDPSYKNKEWTLSKDGNSYYVEKDGTVVRIEDILNMQ